MLQLSKSAPSIYFINGSNFMFEEFSEQSNFGSKTINISCQQRKLRTSHLILRMGLQLKRMSYLQIIDHFSLSAILYKVAFLSRLATLFPTFLIDALRTYS
ncbi:uncharacterized protein DS421_19g662720 [Arachis hypogaea]|uniref:Uncharacterized protein n=1 Tax=Arachis hypogaea TaxID=3818 RepID=A0A6B9VD64_ARAHY|nr:uncharacterized protein DS421_19g662720 [Arachis hypogaea]